MYRSRIHAFVGRSVLYTGTYCTTLTLLPVAFAVCFVLYFAVCFVLYFAVYFAVLPPPSRLSLSCVPRPVPRR
eukprot:471643-Pyramimonas_sp.AAC.2